MNKPYVHSNYERIPDDDYKTVDPRCVRALIDMVPVWGYIVDCCSPTGSGIVNQLKEIGLSAFGVADAFADFFADWIITNPPYTRGLVDRIVWKQIQRLEQSNARGLAILVRNNWDFAKGRYEMFTHPFYAGQVHMMFRPYWMSEKKSEPIHNFVWHVWRTTDIRHTPEVWYWREK